jgi:hypothetical protein
MYEKLAVFVFFPIFFGLIIFIIWFGVIYQIYDLFLRPFKELTQELMHEFYEKNFFTKFITVICTLFIIGWLFILINIFGKYPLPQDIISEILHQWNTLKILYDYNIFEWLTS